MLILFSACVVCILCIACCCICIWFHVASGMCSISGRSVPSVVWNCLVIHFSHCVITSFVFCAAPPSSLLSVVRFWVFVFLRFLVAPDGF